MYTCILDFFTMFFMFFKNKNISSKVKRSKVTDYAALKVRKKASKRAYLHSNFSNLSYGIEMISGMIVMIAFVLL